MPMHIHKDINQFEAIFYIFSVVRPFHMKVLVLLIPQIPNLLMYGSRDKIVKVRCQSERVARIRENRHEIHIKTPLPPSSG